MNPLTDEEWGKFFDLLHRFVNEQKTKPREKADKLKGVMRLYSTETHVKAFVLVADTALAEGDE